MKKFLFLFILYFLNLLSFGQFNFRDPVRWEFRSEDMNNGIYELFFTGDIEKPWHVYAIKLENAGPIPTSIHFEKTEEFSLEGDLNELVKPVIKYDPGFQFNVGMYDKAVKLKQRIKINSAKEALIKGYIEYQCCNDETCLPPFQQEFSFLISGLKASTQIKTEVDKSSTEKSVTKEVISASEDNETLISKISDNAIIKEKESTVSISDNISAPESQKESLFIFLLLAFMAGLAAILTPCVFPMIPMTVSFFMQGSSKRGLAVLKGLIFGLSIILVYTGLGVIVGLTGIGADTGTIISTHWIPNILFFLIFIIFAASFFGMFELIIPAGLINKTDRQADKGGITGAFFMGLTTVLVSFSCTGPIVGSLLIESAGGLAWKPILGMFFFSLAFAIPFTFLAIFPSVLKKLPKSGGWLNSVKVVLGFIILAFSLKFLSAVDQSYHLKLLNREIYLAIWFILAILLGLYLLGKIKFAHDSDLPFVSVPRLVLAISSFVFAVYLFTGILGADLKSIASLIPPKNTGSFSLSSPAPSIHEFNHDANYCGPGKYAELFNLPYGLKGYFNYEDGLKCAVEKNKPIFLDFTGHSCSNCKQMENQVWSDPAVLRLLKEDYVIISLYTDDKTKVADEDIITLGNGKMLRSIGEINKQFEIENFKSISTPLYVLLDHNGNLLAPAKGKDLNIQNFIDFLMKGKEEFK